MTVLDNVIYGRSQEFTNVGIYVWDWRLAGTCHSRRVQGNHVQWHNSDGAAAPFWNGGNCGEIEGLDDNE